MRTLIRRQPLQQPITTQSSKAPFRQLVPMTPMMDLGNPMPPPPMMDLGNPMPPPPPLVLPDRKPQELMLPPGVIDEGDATQYYPGIADPNPPTWNFTPGDYGPGTGPAEYNVLPQVDAAQLSKTLGNRAQAGDPMAQAAWNQMDSLLNPQPQAAPPVDPVAAENMQKMQRTFGKMLDSYVAANEQAMRDMESARRRAPWQQFVRDVYAPAVSGFRPGSAKAMQNLQKSMSDQISYGQKMMSSPEDQMASAVKLGNLMQQLDPQSAQNMYKLGLIDNRNAETDRKWNNQLGLQDARQQNIDYKNKNLDYNLIPRTQGQIDRWNSQNKTDQGKNFIALHKVAQGYQQLELKQNELLIKAADSLTKANSAKSMEEYRKHLNDYKDIQGQVALSKQKLDEAKTLAEQLSAGGETMDKYPGLANVYPELAKAMKKDQPTEQAKPEAQANDWFESVKNLLSGIGTKKQDTPPAQQQAKPQPVAPAPAKPAPIKSSAKKSPIPMAQNPSPGFVPPPPPMMPSAAPVPQAPANAKMQPPPAPRQVAPPAAVEYYRKNKSPRLRQAFIEKYGVDPGA